jgi:HK97 family phage major capsid protein
MPEINYGELIAGEIKSLADKIASDKAERATADESRKKEIDSTLAKLDNQLSEFKSQLAANQKHAITGIEYGAKGEKDKPTWTRLLQAVAEPQRLNHKDYGPEKEAIDYARKTAINAGTGASGGFLVPTSLMAGIVPELRERSVARQLGATVLSGLTPGAHQFAKSRGGITAVHINTEEEQSGTESVPTFDQITLSPRTAAAFVPMTRGMMNQSAEALEPWVRGEISKQIALLQDKQFFVGTGTAGAPRGVLNHPSVGTFDFVETSISSVWKSLVDAVEDVRNAFALDLDGLGWVCEPAARFWLARLTDTTGRPMFDALLNASASNSTVPKSILGYRIEDTAQVSASDSANRVMAFGPWSSGLIGEWGTLELVLNTESDTNFLKARGTVRGLFDYDAGVLQAAAFTKASGFNSAAAIPTAL